MAEQKKARVESKNDQVEPEPTNTEETIDTTEIDNLIDDIDDVLEENAEEFVKNFVQRGGQ